MRSFNVSNDIHIVHSEDVVWIYNYTDASHPEKLTLSCNDLEKIIGILQEAERDFDKWQIEVREMLAEKREE